MYSGGQDFAESSQSAGVTFRNLQPNMCCDYHVRVEFAEHTGCDAMETRNCCSGSFDWVELGMEIAGLSVEEYEDREDLQTQLSHAVSNAAGVPNERHFLALAQNIKEDDGTHVGTYFLNRVFASSEEESDAMENNIRGDDFDELANFVGSGSTVKVSYLQKTASTPSPTIVCPDGNLSAICTTTTASSVHLDISLSPEYNSYTSNVEYTVCQICEYSTTCMQPSEVGFAYFENLDSSTCCTYSIVASFEDSECDRVEYTECCTSALPCQSDIDCLEGVCGEDNFCVTLSPTAYPSPAPTQSDCPA
jgi:hypothetical protein